MKVSIESLEDGMTVTIVLPFRSLSAAAAAISTAAAGASGCCRRRRATAPTTPTTVPPPPVPPVEIYVPKTGIKFHKYENCGKAKGMDKYEPCHAIDKSISKV